MPPGPSLAAHHAAQHAARDLAARRIAVTDQGVRLACAFMAVQSACTQPGAMAAASYRQLLFAV